ncbi:CUB domain protein [Necator americanus]|uniref:CUB domain protein n=1 Tax=Necator americanus TaxID=51031 RepID=W2T5N5_NECAM|nr:CUB domain protein [Necator americanus]ETN77218.1 CUB domain protein [Necator americanus]
MHYGPFGFASDPDKPTIRTLERIQQSTIGQRISPSFLDYQAVSNKTRFINSVNYPHGFKKGVECFWLLRAPREGRVFLEFAEPFEFLCEDTCDKSYVEVKYHSDKRLTGARYCCSSPPKERFISLDNELVVIMREYVEGYRGFRAKFWSDVSEPILETTKYITSAIQTTPTSTRQATLPITTETPKTTEDLLAIPKISFTDKTVEPTHRWSEKPFTLTSTRRNTPKTGTKNVTVALGQNGLENVHNHAVVAAIGFAQNNVIKPTAGR